MLPVLTTVMVVLCCVAAYPRVDGRDVRVQQLWMAIDVARRMVQ
jgi:hypothetical protein